MSVQKRWPKNQRAARDDTKERADRILRAIRKARVYAEEASGNIKRNPIVARDALRDQELILADIEIWTIEIQLFMEQASQGIE